MTVYRSFSGCWAETTADEMTGTTRQTSKMTQRM